MQPFTSMLVAETLSHIGTHEDFPYVNRGTEVDIWNKEAVEPLGSPWCASFVGAMVKGNGFTTPRFYAACQSWHTYGTGLRQTKPQAGDVILYNFAGGELAHHCGIITEVLPDRLHVVEGNTSGIPNDREGYAVFLKGRSFDSERDDGTSLNSNYLQSQLRSQGILGWVTPVVQPTPASA